MKIVIYGSANCPPCRFLKKDLDVKNIEYEYKTIETAMKEFQVNKIKVLPTIFIGKKRIEGYQPELLQLTLEEYYGNT